MKKTLLLFLFLGVVVNAQENKQPKSNFLYLGASLIDVGNYFGQGIDLNYVYDEKVSFSLGVMYNLYYTVNNPDDRYHDWITDGISSANHIFFTVGKIVKMKKSDRIRWNLSVGLAKTWNRVEENFVRGEQTDKGYYYSNDIGKYENLSLIFNTKLEMTIFSFIGLQISPKVIFNEKKSFYGIGFGFMLGKLRQRLY